MYSKLWIVSTPNSEQWVFCILSVGRGRGRARAYRKSHGERSMRDASSSNTPNKGQTQHYTSNIVLKGLRIIKVDNIWVYENWCIRGIQPALCWDGFRWIQIRWSGIVENTEEFVALCVEIRQAPLFLFTAMQTPATTQQVATWMEMATRRWQPAKTFQGKYSEILLKQTFSESATIPYWRWWWTKYPCCWWWVWCCWQWWQCMKQWCGLIFCRVGRPDARRWHQCANPSNPAYLAQTAPGPPNFWPQIPSICSHCRLTQIATSPSDVSFSQRMTK